MFKTMITAAVLAATMGAAQAQESPKADPFAGWVGLSSNKPALAGFPILTPAEQAERDKALAKQMRDAAALDALPPPPSLQSEIQGLRREVEGLRSDMFWRSLRQ